MTEWDQSKMAKAIGGVCGSLAGFSTGIGVLVLMMSLTIKYYHVEAWAVVSIMVGIALACILTRVTLLLQYCRDCTPNNMFKPLAIVLILFIVGGFGLGLLVPSSYNADEPNKICYDMANGLETNSTKYTMEQCTEYRHNVQMFLDGALSVIPLSLILWIVVDGWYRFRR